MVMGSAVLIVVGHPCWAGFVFGAAGVLYYKLDSGEFYEGEIETVEEFHRSIDLPFLLDMHEFRGRPINVHQLQRAIIDRIFYIQNANPSLQKSITCNVQIATALQDCMEFNPFNRLDGPPAKPFLIGDIKGIDIWVDPNMSWTDTRVIWSDNVVLKITNTEILI